MSAVDRLVEIAETFFSEKKKKKSWSNSGSLTPGQSTGSISMQAEFESDPGNYTLQFNIEGPENTGAHRRTVADIVWSVEGNSVTRTIDVVEGTTISGTAQAISVKIRDESVFVGGGAYVVSCQVTKGTRPSVQQPPYLSLDEFRVGPGAAQDFRLVPQNAGVISVLVTVSPFGVGNPIPDDQDVQVCLESSGGTLMRYSPLVQNSWVPLPSGTTFVTVKQAAGTPDLCWKIIFGIDG